MRGDRALRRREFLRGLALVAGGALSPACDRFLGAHPAGAPLPPASRRVLDAEQRATLAAAAERVIPETDTPGARSAGVPEFIELLLADWFEAGERDAFLAGLARPDDEAGQRGSAGFAAPTTAVQDEILAALEAEARPGAFTAPERSLLPTGSGQLAPPRDFFPALKELVVVGYYTSERGATEELRFAAVPGRFSPCLPVERAARQWLE